MSDYAPLIGWLQGYGPDVVAFLFSVVLVAGYYIRLRRRASANPLSSVLGLNALARRRWVEHVMTTPGMEIVAVQTLRNFIMVGIMMASTASLLILGTLTLSGQVENISQSWHVMSLFGSHSPQLWILKVMCLLADFLVAFFAYAMSMRLANQVLFMLNVPHRDQGILPALSPECVAKRLVRAGNMVAIGMRAYLFAIPLVFWLFGSIFLALATVGLVITLNYLDRYEAADSESSLDLPLVMDD